MSAVAFRASGTVKTGNGGSPSAVIPSAVQVGDSLWLFVSVTTSNIVWSSLTAAGWTPVATPSPDWSMGSTYLVFQRTAQAGDAGSTVTTTASDTGSAPIWAAVVVAYYGGNGQYTSARQITKFGPNTVAPSVSAGPGLLVNAFILSDNGNSQLSGSVPTPSGTTQRVNGGNTQRAWLAVVDSVKTTAGASTAQSIPVWGNNLAFGVSIVLSSNQPPNTASWVSPANGSVLDRSINQVLTYSATDPDSGDSQSKRKWRYSSDGGTTWTETTETTVSQSITIAGGTLAAGDYQFQVEIADQSGTWAASWSPSLHLTFADAPSAPTIIEPTSGGTVAGTNTLAWSFPDQQQYEVRKVADNAGTADPSTIYYDTGNVTDANTRQVTLVNDTNGRWEHQQIRCMNSTGLWSPWADSRVDVTFDPPPTPTVTLTPVVDPFADPPKAAITVTVATAAPGTGEVAATSVTVEARPVGATTDEWSRSGQPISGDVDFETPASGVEYEFRVTAYADNGATADTGWLTASSS